MEQISYYSSAAALLLVIGCWFAFGAVFLIRTKPEATIEGAKAPRSYAGLVLQGVGFLPIWFFWRSPAFSDFIDGMAVLNIALQVLAVVLAAFSVWLAMSAVRELGKQWSLQARLVAGHKLITSGVYQIVRHPIYTAMLGMLVATGIVYSRPLPTLTGIVIFLIGTQIRTHSEEKLLTDAFGSEFKDWKAKVPGLIPFLKI